MTTVSRGFAPRRAAEFDGLRGLLALWVVISHILCWCGFADIPNLSDGAADYWTNFIYAQPAVDTFIILSGFAISALIHEGNKSYAGFMVNRVFRIYPVYLICLLLGFLSSALVPHIISSLI